MSGISTIKQRLGNDNMETVPTVSHSYSSSEAPYEKLAARSRGLKQLESKTERKTIFIVQPQSSTTYLSLILKEQNHSKTFLLLMMFSFSFQLFPFGFQPFFDAFPGWQFVSREANFHGLVSPQKDPPPSKPASLEVPKS